MNKITADVIKKNFAETKHLETIDGLKLAILGSEWLEPFNTFIANIYSGGSEKFHLNEKEVAMLTEESAVYFPHTKLAAVLSPDDRLVATWGLILKDTREPGGLVLPLEKQFHLNFDTIKQQMNSDAVFFFNGWRTAIDKNIMHELGFDKPYSIRIFDMLLRILVEDFAEESRFYMGIAEMENIVLRYHRRIGIPWQKLGEAKSYLGAERYPCAFKLEEFEANLKENYPERYDFVYKINKK